MNEKDLAGIADGLMQSLCRLSREGWSGFDCSKHSLDILERWEASRNDMPERLTDIESDLGDCRRCRLSDGRTHIVFGAGDADAKLVFVGEGPGYDEDKKGQPFVGRAGQLLTKIIQAMGLTRDQVYICNIVKCRPPDNRNPRPDEIEACSPFLERQLTAIRPDYICALGTFAAQTLLHTTVPISRLRGKFHNYIGIRLMPTYHPAYLLRNPGKKRDVWEDMQKIMEEMELTA